MKQELKDTATNASLSNQKGSVLFKCPSCGKTDVKRSFRSRVIATKYKCTDCGFEGPN
ncbi:MAG TPA: zinc finger domain-containing protein [Candidatus Nanoarchaeia archaeon]|nr:zinc finger domain-containing protein [Candidatus Nanoarchaeia archaeon]